MKMVGFRVYPNCATVKSPSFHSEISIALGDALSKKPLWLLEFWVIPLGLVVFYRNPFTVCNVGN